MNKEHTIYPIDNKFPSDLSTDRLIREKDKLSDVIQEAVKCKYINYSSIVSHFNIVCNELRRRGILL